MRTRMYSSIAALSVLASVAAVGQTLSPREIFYGQEPAAEAKAKPRVRKKVMASSSPAPAASAPSAPAPPADSQPVPAPPSDYVPVKHATDRHPLALRYSIKKFEGGGYAEVDPDTTFHEGDRIALVIETNDAGYLYVVDQGSSGHWQVKYPTEAVSGSNRVERGQTYRIPRASDEVMTFDSRAGTERLFVVLTRRPVPDLENLIYSLQGEKPKPADEGKTMLAQNIAPIGDDLVSNLRTVYSRDLLIEKVNDAKAPAASEQAPAVPQDRLGEKAVYVVNMSAAADARVVADIALRHE